VLAVALGSGAAYATSASTTQVPASGARPIISAITGELGISAEQLRTDLGSGQTLAGLASASNLSLGGLEQAILAGAQTRLDQAVVAGRLTSQEEQAALSRLSSRLGTLLDASHPFARLGRGIRARFAVLGLSAGYLGLTPPQLRSELGSGKTLADLATGAGKTASGLVQAIVTAFQTRLDAAVAAGRSSAQREQTMLSTLQTRLDTLVNRDLAG